MTVKLVKGTHPGAAVHECTCDSQHVRVLGQLEQVPLELFFILGDLAELHLQPLQLLLKTANDFPSAMLKHIILTHSLFIKVSKMRHTPINKTQHIMTQNDA